MVALFDEVTSIQENFDTNRNSKFVISPQTTRQNSNIFKNEGFNRPNLKLFHLEFNFLDCKKVFSLMSSNWQNERNRCFVELIKSEVSLTLT